MKNTIYFSLVLILLLALFGCKTSDNSNSSGGHQDNPDSVVPLAPYGLSMTAMSTSAIELRWSRQGDNEQGFLIECSLNEFTNYHEIDSTNTGVTRYVIYDLTPDTLYFCRVRAFNNAGQSEYTAVASAYTQAAPASRPATPGNLRINYDATSGVTLDWDDVSNEEAYIVERSLQEFAEYVPISIVPAGETHYASSAILEAGTTYYYRVIARNTVGDSDPSLVVSITTQAVATEVPEAPTILVASATSSDSITLSWFGVANETGYKIERSIDGVSFNQINIVDANISNYVDTGLAAFTRYYYRVCAYNSVGDSAYSNTNSARTNAGDGIAPEAPTGLLATATSETSVVLTWRDVDNETGYEIEKGWPGRFGVIARNLAANLTTYTVTGLSAGSTYNFRMRAFNSSGYSTYSTEVSITTPTSSNSDPKVLRIINDLDNQVYGTFPNQSDWGLWNQIVRVRIAPTEAQVLEVSNNYEQLAPYGDRASNASDIEVIQPGYLDAVTSSGSVDPRYSMEFSVDNMPNNYSIFVAAGWWEYVTAFTPAYWQKTLVTVTDCVGQPTTKWATVNITEHTGGVMNVKMSNFLPDWGWQFSQYCN